MTDDRALLERAARSERSRRDNELTAVRSECERLKVELAICREAIEVCYDVADNLPSDDDGDAAVRRTTLRRLNEAIGKAAPRLLMERREGQKMYGLHYRELHAEVERLREAKDGAYLERNRCVALIARMALAMGLRAGLARTAIEGWSDDWHGCVYINLPTGQCSWHFHDSQAYLFDGLPAYAGQWDGHTTPQKYERVDAAMRQEPKA